MRKVLLIIMSLVFMTVRAQEETKLKNSNFSASLELTSKYMWRGIEYGDAPVVFPSLNYSYKGFSAFAMGGYATNGSHQEVDVGVSYTYDWISAGVSDYFYPSAVGEKDNYFTFKNRETGHSLEAYVTLNPHFAPMWLTLSTYVAGADKNLEGKQAYSSYAELGYNFNFKNDNVLGLCVGAALNKGFYTDYEKGLNVVNVGVKYSTKIHFGKFALPVSASYILNPYKEKSYVSFSLFLNS